MRQLLMAVLALAVMAGCSSETAKPDQNEAPQPKPAEYLTGRAAIQKLYIAARGWAADAKPYRLESLMTADAKGKEGKSGVWRAGFASAQQRSVKPYVWSGVDASDAPSRGISPGTEDTYTATNSSTQVFDIAFLKVDSDQALDVAQKHGGDKILEKDPDTPVIYMLDWSRAANQLIWHVSYGPSRDQAKLMIAVNATTGEFIRAEK